MLTCRNKFLTYQEKNVWLYEWIASRMKHNVIYIMIYMFSIYRFIAFVHWNIPNLYNWRYLIIIILFRTVYLSNVTYGDLYCIHHVILLILDVNMIMLMIQHYLPYPYYMHRSKSIVPSSLTWCRKFVIRTLHDCPSQMNENLLISNGKLTSDSELIWWC